jgi:putative transposase
MVAIEGMYQWKYPSVAMRELIISLLHSLSFGLRTRTWLHLELLALRHQLMALQRKVPARPKLMLAHRWLWVVLSRLWSAWRSSLVMVKPETVAAWHRKGIRLYRAWKSRPQLGRPKIPAEWREIQEMSWANPLWGAPRIHGELLKLGLDVSQAMVAKYMVRNPGSPSPSWRTFLNNHLSQLASIDFFTVPTVWFETLFVFVVLAHDRRRVMHF